MITFYPVMKTSSKTQLLKGRNDNNAGNCIKSPPYAEKNCPTESPFCGKRLHRSDEVYYPVNYHLDENLT